MTILYDCYTQIADLLGQDAEPYESVELVEQYRQFWRPNDVRIILLAESHIFTSNLDRELELKTIKDLLGYPSNYAKFVYCLAYGENSLTIGENHPPKDGCPQFWKVLFSCTNQIQSSETFAPIQKSPTPTNQRIQNKVNLLKQLQQNGIWLIDASIMALYDKGKKPSNKVMAKTIRTSWSCYTRNVIREADPDHIIVVGKGVADILEQELNDLMDTNYTVIAQANARLTAEQHHNNFKTYYRLCSSPTAI